MVNVAARATFRDVFSVRQFRALWLAQVLSVAGDRLALVALVVLVFTRTHSPLMTAAAYAVTYLPWLIGGLLLSGLADRYRRRGVMIGCDVVRCALTAIMALPGVPLVVLVLLLFAVTTLAPPFESARAAVLPGILPGDRYVVGTAVARLTNQIGFVAGFASGGVTVELAGPRMALAADAATFAVSALLIRFGVRAGARAAGHREKRGPGAIRVIFASRQLRILTLLAWLAAFYVVPEGLAVPYAHQLGGGAVMAGLLLAAMPTGMGVGVVAFGRLVAPERRMRVMAPVAACCCLPLLACWLHPDLAATMTIFAATGVLSAYQLAANAAFVRALPDRFRGQAFGLVMTGFSLGQSAALVAAGALAQELPVTSVIAISGAVGTVAAAVLAALWSRAAAGGLAVADPPVAARRGRPTPSAEGSEEVQM
ncbi:MAG TPA: MFS transporter [Streptosporangiaceae bacterium]|jgi:MFS family permease